MIDEMIDEIIDDSEEAYEEWEEWIDPEDIDEDSDELMHYGMPRRSGRYPYGSGEDPYQHGRDFLARIDELKKTGWTETPENIKAEFDISTTQYRTEKRLAEHERKMLKIERARSLKEDGKGWTEIAREMGESESTVRTWLTKNNNSRIQEAINTADFLKKRVAEVGMIDVGTGVERELNISSEMLKESLAILKRDGYEVFPGRFEQVTNPGQNTTQTVLCPPGSKHKDIYNLDEVHTVKDYISRDGGKTYEKKFYYPESLDSKRLMIRYKEDGGIDKDGIVELRRGVADLSLGESRYSQVRIMVDGSHYIKGMAVYADDKDMPKGVDVIFNTNKTKDVPLKKVLKEIKDDPDNPFGSLIKDADQGGQYWYDADTGKRCGANDPTVKNKKLGLINKRADEGDWEEWADALPSQFLGKQSMKLAKQQLGIAKNDKQAEFDELCSLTNPTVKKHLLEKFADSCDSAAVHLKAAALPGQKYHVIIPINTLKDNEVYAPKYNDGDKLALIRYPHGGTFEIPILTVNNSHKQARKLLGTDITDAVGINAKVAERLSGADFDGDTVMCIPTGGKVKITSTSKLKDLDGFDPKTAYPEVPGMKYMKDPITKSDNTQKQMGEISNLITDMTLAGATEPELARAVKHSMVVIDAGKHKLNYKKSEIDNNISQLKRDYQKQVLPDGTVKYGGASTILSRSKGQYQVERRQGSPKVNVKGSKDYDPTRPEGALVYKKADNLHYVDAKTDKATGIKTIRTVDGKKIKYDLNNPDEVAKYNPVKRVDPETGEISFTDASGTITYRSKTKKQQSTRMAETDNPYELVSAMKHPMELLYADYASSMKSMANKARLEMIKTGNMEYKPSAKKAYINEYNSIMKQLNTAELNAPRERAAQRMANVEVAAKKKANPTMSKSDEKKIRQQAITKYRQEVGGVSRKDRAIHISDREWEAIQAGAINETTLKRILKNTDVDNLRERATPRSTSKLPASTISRIKSLSATYTIAQIAEKFNISPSMVSKYLKE